MARKSRNIKSIIHNMPMRSEDRYIFTALKKGEKKVETRGGGPKYANILEGDLIEFRCGKDKFRKTVKRIRKFKTVSGLLKAYKLKDITPWLSDDKELKQLLFSFPGYKERLKKYGLTAFEFKT